MAKKLSEKQLYRLLMKAKTAYYNATPMMEDDEFDVLEEQLRTMNPTHVYFSKIGALPDTPGKIGRVEPMRSMKKVHNRIDLEKYLIKIKKILGMTTDPYYVYSNKIDGMSCEILYKNGEPTTASTRGEGYIGQDISHIISVVKGIDRIPFTGDIIIRGELALPEEEMIEGGKSERNSASGIVNRKKVSDDLSKLVFIAYRLVFVTPRDVKSFPTYSSTMKRLDEWGFYTPRWGVTNRPHLVVSAYHEKCKGKTSNKNKEILQNLDRSIVWGGDAGSFTLVIDGVVLELDEIDKWALVDSEGGIVDHHNHHNIAIKPPPAKKTSKLLEVIWQATRIGKLTPVGIIEPIKFGKTDQNQVSLFSLQTIYQYMFKLKDEVMVAKRGEVIAVITQNISALAEARDPEKYEPEVGIIPDKCPYCDSRVRVNGSHLFCSAGVTCPGVIPKRVEYYLKYLKIKGAGDAVVAKLCERYDITDISQIYKLTQDDFDNVSLGSVGRKLIKQLLTKVPKDDADLIAACGIEGLTRDKLLDMNVSIDKDTDGEYQINFNNNPDLESPEYKTFFLYVAKCPGEIVLLKMYLDELTKWGKDE